MASSDIRLTRQEVAESMLQACKELPCAPVAKGSYGTCSICPWRGKSKKEVNMHK